MSYENNLFAAIHGEATLYTAFLKPHEFNRYIYCNDNPVRYTDPLGLDAFDNIADFAAGVGDALSFGLTRVVRQIAGTDYIHSEGVYNAGVITGTVADVAAGGVGLVKGGLKIAGRRALKYGASENRAFWSGGKAAKEAAEAWAKKNGGATLEMTTRGKEISSLTQGMDWSKARGYWEKASREFANGASGDAHVFHGSKGVRVDSIWRRVEYPALRRNPRINIKYKMAD